MCLQIGRKGEATDAFNQVQKMMIGSVGSPRKTGDLDDLLGTQSSSASLHDSELEVLCLMNR